jgi:hypothetical protein
MLGGNTDRFGWNFRPPNCLKNCLRKFASALASGLQICWSCARFEASTEIYKITQRTIIVHQRKIKPYNERFDLSIKDKLVKPPNSKTLQVFHTKFVFDELELVMRMNTCSKTSHGQETRTIEKHNANHARVWALSEQYNQVIHSRALFIVRPTTYNPDTQLSPRDE